MGIIINAVILYVLVSVLGDSSEVSTRWKVLGIAAAVVLIETAVSMSTTSIVANLVLIVLTTTGVAVALVTWCKLARSTAIKIAAIFLAIRIILALGAMWLVSRMSAVA
ncbi:MAG: hypothetical protein IRZ28_20545 [Steroidobacteraceae bacterium]|nr:hypothetical protein [Steroidobacteraceae bacterium]